MVSLTKYSTERFSQSKILDVKSSFYDLTKLLLDDVRIDSKAVEKIWGDLGNTAVFEKQAQAGLDDIDNVAVNWSSEDYDKLMKKMDIAHS